MKELLGCSKKQMFPQLYIIIKLELPFAVICTSGRLSAGKDCAQKTPFWLLLFDITELFKKKNPKTNQQQQSTKQKNPTTPHMQ